MLGLWIWGLVRLPATETVGTWIYPNSLPQKTGLENRRVLWIRELGHIIWIKLSNVEDLSQTSKCHDWRASSWIFGTDLLSEVVVSEDVLGQFKLLKSRWQQETFCTCLSLEARSSSNTYDLVKDTHKIQNSANSFITRLCNVCSI